MPRPTPGEIAAFRSGAGEVLAWLRWEAPEWQMWWSLGWGYHVPLTLWADRDDTMFIEREWR